jgi:hypothetical protein
MVSKLLFKNQEFSYFKTFHIAGEEMYSNYKKIGVIVDHNPVIINQLGTETFITASIFDSFQVFKYDNLSVCLVSKKVHIERPITGFQVYGHDTFLSVDDKILVYDRIQIVRVYNIGKRITHTLVLGRVLLIIDESQHLTVSASFMEAN